MAKPIKIEIVGDASKFTAALGKADNKLAGIAKGAAKYGTLLAAGLAAGGIAAGAALLDLATDLQDIDQKINTVFGDEGRQVAAWADSINEQLGVTSTQVQLMAANIADLLKPMGASTAEAAAMSQELVELAPALAEWSGGTMTAAEVSEVLAKAMLGEREQLKGLGISINQAEVDTRALAIAQAEGRDEITAMDKALATQQLIFEKSTDAQAGFSGGTETLGGQANFLRAKLAELKETLARVLLPVLLRVGTFLVEKMTPVFTEIRGGVIAFSSAWKAADGDVTSSGFPGFMEKLANLFRRVQGGFVTLVAAFQEHDDFGATGFSKFMADVGILARDVVDGFTTMKAAFQERDDFGATGVGGFMAQIGIAAGELFDLFQLLAGFIKRRVIPVVTEIARVAFPLLVDAVETVIGIIGSASKWLRENEEILIALGIVIGGALVAAFVSWAVSAGAAAVATIAAAAPVIALGAALTALVAGVIWAYRNIDFFRNSVDAAGRFLRDKFWPALKKVGAAIWDFQETARAVADAVVDFIVGLPDRITSKVSSFIQAGKDLGNAIKDGIKDGLTSAVGFVRDLGAAAWKAIKDLVNSKVVDKLNRAIPDSIGVGPFSFDLPDNPVPRLFSGTGNFRGGLAMLGEMGRELAFLPRGTQVLPNRDTEALLAGADSVTNDITVHVHGNASGEDVASALAWQLRSSGR